VLRRSLSHFEGDANFGDEKPPPASLQILKLIRCRIENVGLLPSGADMATLTRTRALALVVALDVLFSAPSAHSQGATSSCPLPLTLRSPIRYRHTCRLPVSSAVF
jgi:hypothetical protein